jgi:ABC-type transport system involved in multi-copper enzyme maturation permease subunit
MSAIALRMFGADCLKVRRKRGIMIWALVLTLGVVLVFLLVGAILHSANAQKYEPAGGSDSFRDGIRVLALLFGPLAAILIGVEAGTGDASAGVFRDLVVTGRSRLALFASRVPAALAVCWAVILSAFLVLVLGVYALAGGLPTPGAALLLNGLGFVLLATGVICVVAVAFASIIALIAWQVVASPLLVSITALGRARAGVLSQAIAHFSPVHVDGGGRGASVSLSSGTAVLVLLAWIALFCALGAWRTSTMDA